MPRPSLQETFAVVHAAITLPLYKERLYSYHILLCRVTRGNASSMLFRPALCPNEILCRRPSTIVLSYCRGDGLTVLSAMGRG